MEIPAETLRAQSITVDLDPAFAEVPTVTDRLREVAAQHGVMLSLRLQNHLPTHGKEVAFAQFQTFKGNQKDAIGSWNFLFSPDHGPLAMFAGEVRALMVAAGAEQDEQKREALLQALHQQVLDEAYGVPFWMEAPAILASDRIGLSKINRFDLRLRFYDVVWK